MNVDHDLLETPVLNDVDRNKKVYRGNKKKICKNAGTTPTESRIGKN